MESRKMILMNLFAGQQWSPPASAGHAGLIPGSGRSPGEGNGNPLQCSCLGNPMDREAWWAFHGVTKRDGHDLVTKQQRWRCRLREQTCGHHEGRRGWDKLRV